MRMSQLPDSVAFIRLAAGHDARRQVLDTGEHRPGRVSRIRSPVLQTCSITRRNGAAVGLAEDEATHDDGHDERLRSDSAESAIELVDEVIADEMRRRAPRNALDRLSSSCARAPTGWDRAWCGTTPGWSLSDQSSCSGSRIPSGHRASRGSARCTAQASRAALCPSACGSRAVASRMASCSSSGFMSDRRSELVRPCPTISSPRSA